MKTLTCDVLVIGAGPAGLSASYSASCKGLDVIVVEKNKRIGQPVKTSALTWNEVVKEWVFDKSSIADYIDKIILNYSPKKSEVVLNFDKVVGATLNYSVFLEQLANKTTDAGARLFLSSSFKKPFKVNGCICGGEVNLNGNDTLIKAKITIDASGPNAVLARQTSDYLGNKYELGVGLEYEMENITNFPQGAVGFYVGADVVPVGYGWVFSSGAKRARIGVCTVYNTKENIRSFSIRECLDNFLSPKSLIYNVIKNAKLVEEHGGNYALASPLEKPYGAGYLVVGDAASHASAMLGEGIRYALEFGKYAAITSFDAILQGDVSENALASYDYSCKGYLGEKFCVAQDLLKPATNLYWEVVVKNLARLKRDDKLNLVLDYFKTNLDYKKAHFCFPEFSKYLGR